MLKAYKYRIYPDKEQKEMIKVNFGACRFVYNWALEQKIKTYEQNKKSIFGEFIKKLSMSPP